MTKRILNFREACLYLNFSQNYLYKLTSGGVIPYSRPTRGRLYFDREKLDEWLMSGMTLSSHEKEIQASTYVSKNPKSYGK